MTEAEWLACGEALRLFCFLGAQMSDRKYRLLQCAWLHEVELVDERSKDAVAVAERFADGNATEGEQELALDGARQAYESCRAPYTIQARFRAAAAVHAVGAIDTRAMAQRWASAIQTVERIGHVQPDDAHCQRIRDIFGNPFRPVTFSSVWRTSTAVALASQMYESRDFGAMPILGDALQAAGCDSADVLDHCRAPGLHARGCWVVDLVLGKE